MLVCSRVGWIEDTQCRGALDLAKNTQIYSWLSVGRTGQEQSLASKLKACSHRDKCKVWTFQFKWHKGFLRRYYNCFSENWPTNKIHTFGYMFCSIKLSGNLVAFYALVYSSQQLKWIKKVHQSCPRQKHIVFVGFRTTLIKCWLV